MKFEKPLLLLSFIFSLAVCACSGANHSLRMQPVRKEEEKEYNGDLTIKAVAFESMGDCTLVQLDDIDILIDCGGDNTKFLDVDGHQKVFEFLDTNIKDDKLDYVIITHQDLDHVNAFCATDFSGLPGWLNKPGRTIGTLIDFDSTMDSTVDGWTFKSIHYKDPTLYSETGLLYQKRRDLWIKEGKIETYYTASQLCYKKRIDDNKLSEDEIDTIKEDIKNNNNSKAKIKTLNKSTKNYNIFEITSSSGANAKLNILYNEFNSSNNLVIERQGDSIKNRSTVVNQMSVCSLIEYGEDKFLFTGDLEEFDSASDCKRIFGETKLVENNLEELEGGVMFYRGGHHGSKTSSSAYFCSVIRPQYVYWTGIATDSPGSTSSADSRFPTQNAINNVGRYTDRIYYSMIKKGESVSTMYGSVKFTYSPKAKIGEKMRVSCNDSVEPSSFFLSSLMRKKIKIKAKDKEDTLERSIPLYIYNLTANVPSNYPIDCSYVKIGHIDILIGAGQLGTGSINNKYKAEIVNKIKHLCNDKVLDYLIIPTNNLASYGFLIGKQGLLNNDNLVIKNIYHGEFKDDEAKQLSNELEKFNHKAVLGNNGEPLNVYLDEIYEKNKPNVTIRFLNSISTGNVWERSLITMVSAFGFNYLNLGNNNTFNISQSFEDIIKNNIDVLQIPRCGYMATSDEAEAFYNLVPTIATNKSTHNYQGAKQEDGMVMLLNTTFGKNKDGVLAYPSKHLFLKNSEGSNAGSGSALTYNNKKMLIFPTSKNVDNNDICSPFNNVGNGIKNGDLCLRAWVYSDSIRIGVVPNYSEKEQYLLFNDVSGKMQKELSTGTAKQLTIDEDIKVLLNSN